MNWNRRICAPPPTHLSPAPSATAAISPPAHSSPASYAAALCCQPFANHLSATIWRTQQQPHNWSPHCHCTIALHWLSILHCNNNWAQRQPPHNQLLTAPSGCHLPFGICRLFIRLPTASASHCIAIGIYSAEHSLHRLHSAAANSYQHCNNQSTCNLSPIAFIYFATPAIIADCQIDYLLLPIIIY